MYLNYIIGEPGVGKSTFMAAAFEGIPGYVLDKPFAHTIHGDVVEIGKSREGFSGTDALSMSVQPKVLDWLKLGPYAQIMAEGDRLSTKSFFDGVKEAGYRLTIIALVAPRDEMEHRRIERSARLGVKPQDETWVAGRRTKVANLMKAYNHVTIDATLPVTDMLESVRYLSVFSELEVLRARA